MKYFVLNGPTASGKSSIMDYLLIANRDYMEPIISFTTRKPKPGEHHGKNYYFISSDEYLELKRNNDVIQEVDYLGYHYGITAHELMRVEETGKNGIAIMNLLGIRKMKRNLGYEKVIAVFIYRDFAEIFKSIREQYKNLEEANKRIEMAKQEMREITACDHVVYNISSLADANLQLVNIIKKEINSRPQERPVKPGQKYRHFRGEFCEIVTELAEHTETASPMVIYRSLKTGQLYARPFEIFCGKKEWPPGCGRMVERFALLESTPPIEHGKAKI